MSPHETAGRHYFFKYCKELFAIVADPNYVIDMQDQQIVNQYEIEARTKKATALADLFMRKGATPSTVENLDYIGWQLAAAVAGVNVPSEATRHMTVDIMRQRSDRGLILFDAKSSGYRLETVEIVMTAELPDGHTAYRVDVYRDEAEDEDGSPVAIWELDLDESYWCCVVDGRVFGNDRLEHLSAEYEGVTA